MPTTCELSIITPTQPTRLPKLRTMLTHLAANVVEPGTCELVLIVDAEDDAPLRLARELLPAGIAVNGATQPQQGPARARNRALALARGRWVLFLDDDVYAAPDLLAAHLARLHEAPDSADANLGPCAWPPEMLRTRWGRLLAEMPLVFFWPQLAAAGGGDFRYFWTCNLSVRTDLLRALGGFDGRMPDALHEDIELGWRLAQRYGTRVRLLSTARAVHDHPLSVAAYLNREYRSGRSAAVARDANRPFYDALWSNLGDPAATYDVLRRLFLLGAKQCHALLRGWETADGAAASESDLRAAYLAHLPLKRLVFCHGLLGREYEHLLGELSAP